MKILFDILMKQIENREVFFLAPVFFFLFQLLFDIRRDFLHIFGIQNGAHIGGLQNQIDLFQLILFSYMLVRKYKQGGDTFPSGLF